MFRAETQFSRNGVSHSSKKLYFFNILVAVENIFPVRRELKDEQTASRSHCATVENIFPVRRELKDLQMIRHGLLEFVENIFPVRRELKA